MSHSTVRVLPSSRPAPQTWRATATPPEAEPLSAPVGTARVGTARVGSACVGRIERVGRTWGVPAPDGVPDAARWSGWFALALAEAVLGRRPAPQLAGWVNAEVLAVLNRRQRLRPADEPTPRTVLVSGRVQHPGPRSAEASALLHAGPRLLVLAFRLEAEGGQWVCTALEAGFAPLGRRRRR